MSTTQLGPSRVKWVNNVKNETRQLLREFGQEGKERAVFVKQNASAVKQFLNESEKDRLKEAGEDRIIRSKGEKDRLAIHKEDMAAIKSRLQHLREEEKAIIKDAHDLMRRIAGENKELAGGVHRFLTHSETERLAAYKTMMGDLRKRVGELQRETKDLMKQFSGEHGTLRTELKKFLNESEATRKRDYNKMMGEVRAVVGEIQAHEREERRLTGAGTKEVPSYDVKKKEITHEVKPEIKVAKEITPEAKPEIKVAMEGKLKVEAERKKLMSSCKKCGNLHWPFEKCPQGKSSFKRKEIT